MEKAEPRVRAKPKTTGRFWRALTAMLRWCSFGKIDLDPHFRIDAEDLREQVMASEAELNEVRERKRKAGEELARIEAKVREASREKKSVPQEDLFAVMLLRREIAAHDRNEAMICQRIIIGRENLAMIQLLGYSKPIRIREEVTKISDRLKIQIDGVHVDREIAGERMNDVSAAVSIDALQAQLEEIRVGIVGDEPNDVEPTAVAVEVTPTAEQRQTLRSPQADAARASVGRASQPHPYETMDDESAGYEEFGDDNEPPAPECARVPA